MVEGENINLSPELIEWAKEISELSPKLKQELLDTGRVSTIHLSPKLRGVISRGQEILDNNGGGDSFSTAYTTALNSTNKK
jgi:hypothetical protein